MKVNDKVLIKTKGKYYDKSGNVKKIIDKTNYNIGIEIEGEIDIVWFNEKELRVV